MKVFLSYSRGDQFLADRMADTLEQRGFDVLIDRRDLPYGEQWQAELANLIRSSETVVWLVSQRSVNSKWCKWELGEAMRLSKRLVPVVIEAISPMDLPEALGAIQLLPREGVFDEQAHQQALVDTLETDQEWIRLHTRFADRAHHWLTSNRSASHLLRGAGLSEAQSWMERRRQTAPAVHSDVLALILASRRAASTRRFWLLVGPLLLIAFALAAYAAAMWSRVTSLPDADLLAGDIEQPDGFFGVTSSLAWCRLSCLYGVGNPRCVAFSYDLQASKCYPKLEVGFYKRPSEVGLNPSYSEIMPGVERPSPTRFSTVWDARIFGRQFDRKRLADVWPASERWLYVADDYPKVTYWQVNATQCQRACDALGDACRGFNYSRLKCQLYEGIDGLVQDPSTKSPSFHPGVIAACRNKADCESK